jgi:hypothetical protein
MSKQRFTPGPWKAVEIGQGGSMENPMPIYEIRSADDRAVIAEYVDGWNASILSAAPALLEALEAIEHALRMNFSAGTVLDENSPIREGIRAAIALATGDKQ